MMQTRLAPRRSAVSALSLLLLPALVGAQASSTLKTVAFEAPSIERSMKYNIVLPLDYENSDVGANMVANSFGRAFADQLAALPTGEWSGPVESAFGLHLVIVDARTEERLPVLAEVRKEVARDWSYAQREAASKDFHEQVLSRYRVTVEWPQSTPATEGAAMSQGQP